MRILYANHFLRSLRTLSSELQIIFDERLKLFRENPFDSRLKTHKLSGRLEGYWSFSVTFKHRVLFEFQTPETIVFIDVGDHDVYR